MAPVMSVARELVGITRSTEHTAPIDRTNLSAHPAWTALRASQFGRDFLLQKLLEDECHPFNDDLLHLSLNGLENRSPLLSL